MYPTNALTVILYAFISSLRHSAICQLGLRQVLLFAEG